MLKYWIRSW